MGRPALEVADIFRAHGSAWRQTQQGHLSLGQLKVMSAIEQCRSAALGGHVLRCDACEQVQIAYNSCRNRHCPKCQASAARRWLEARQADLLPVEYYHVVFTLPAPIAAIAYTKDMWPTNELGPHARLIMLDRAPKRRVHPRPIRDLQSVPSAINIKTACNGEVLRKTKFNRPAATDERQIEGPYRRVRLNAWSLSSLSTPNANF